MKRWLHGDFGGETENAIRCICHITSTQQQLGSLII